ncbi:putative serine/threonine-protein kinase [Stylophora pistillata]|uniref:Putative serine/threonine-protein kinase n=1 Tax=Stylophora pistillata TaxID=50429 RepID=A0A2B4RA27_STYPI|nr:putative serine/threonine-protein kinase [Stylophora pistillata]
MKARGYGDVDVAEIVERPHLYIIGRCGSKGVKQLPHVETRQECLDYVPYQVETSDGVKMNDVLRFFHGDGPEQQFESGEQRVGKAGCSGCRGDSRRYRDLTYSFRRPQLSLADRQNIVLAGPAGKAKRNGGIRPLKDMSVAELQRECRARGLCDEGYKKDLQIILKEHLGGIQRVPAMFTMNQGRSLKDLHLDDVKKLCGETLNLVSVTKDQLRGSDYHEICILLAKQLRGFVDEKVQLLLDTMTEIMQILYAKDDEDEDESERESDRNEELNGVGSEDYAEENRLMDHNSEDDEDETDKGEERVIALVQVGEDILGQGDQRNGMEELEKDQEETGVITVQPEELPITGIPVAVKEYNNLSSTKDIQREADVMARCSHPSLPHIFGVNLTQKPYFLVSYFYGINNQTFTLYSALYHPTIPFTKYCAGKIMFEPCQALQHLYMKQLLHRDIKSDNILLRTLHTRFHPMLIDFGKSVGVSEATSKRRSLSAHEQDGYRKKYRHIAPEIILGKPPSFASDLFSVGVVMSDISANIPSERCFLEVERKCLEEDPKLRCSTAYLLNQLERNVSLCKKRKQFPGDNYV